MESLEQKLVQADSFKVIEKIKVVNLTGREYDIQVQGKTVAKVREKKKLIRSAQPMLLVS